MKRTVSIGCMLVILLCSIIIANAENSAQFTLDVDNVKSNRLFDMGVSAQCDSPISGGELELTYDSSVVQYRDVSSGCFEVRAKDYGDKLHIVFAAADAVKCDDTTEIISVSFKSIAQGEFQTQLNVTQCIDDSLQSISASSVFATITVKKDTVTASSKDLSDSKTAPKSKAEKSQAVQAEHSTTESVYSSISVDSSLDTSKAIWYGACAGLAVILAFALGMIFRKKVETKTDTPDNRE